MIVKNPRFFDLFREALFHLEKNLGIFAFIAFFTVLLSGFVDIVVGGSNLHWFLFEHRNYQDLYLAHFSYQEIAAFFLSLILHSLAFIVICLIAQQSSYGEKVKFSSFFDAIRFSLARILKIIYTALIPVGFLLFFAVVFLVFAYNHSMSQVTAAGIMLLLMLVFYMTRWIFALNSLALKGEYGFGAIRYSKNLVNQRWLTVFFYYALSSSLAFLALMAVLKVFSLLGVIFPEISGNDVAILIFSACKLVLSYVVVVFTIIFQTLFFVKIDKPAKRKYSKRA